VDSLFPQPFLEDRCDDPKRLASAFLGLDERVVEIEYGCADLPIGQ